MYFVAMISVMIVLLLMKGFFSGSEIALVNADKLRLAHRAKMGQKGARMVIELFKRPERLLSTTLVGTNIATVTLTTLGTLLMIDIFGAETGDLYALLIYTPLFLILGEIVPKSVYQQKCDLLAPIVIYPLRAFYVVFAPVVVVFSAIARFAARLVGSRSVPDQFFATRDQLRTVMDMAERSADTEVFDRFRIERAIRFGDATVGEEMVPVSDMASISNKRSTADAAEVVQRSGHHRLPVYEGNVSNVIGVATLSLWDLFDPALEARPLKDVVAPAHFVSAHQPLVEVMPALRERPDHMAIVVDEFGSAIGMITLEDVMEAVVGDISVGHEFDEAHTRRRHGYDTLEEGVWLVDGQMPISELNELLGINLAALEAHTVGGMVMARLRHLPKAEETVIEAGYRFTVEEATPKRVTKVRVERMHKKPKRKKRDDSG